jgi:predicted nucleic acid-binding Zn ribbon protein
MEPKTAKKCLECGKAVLGRIDKKFCNDWCRNNYNNKQKSEVNGQVKFINAILMKNRKILETLLPENSDTVKAAKQKLLDKGFNFSFFTHIYKTKKGTEYFFCYEYGYLVMEHDYYFIVKRKEGL